MHGAVEALLGGPVVRAASQRGGFSPGTADRVLTRDGRRAFVKAVHPDLDAHAAGLHRREAEVAAGLPSHLPAPGLLGRVEEDGWVVLVLDDVEGHLPRVPWLPDELDAVLTALRGIAVRPPGPEPAHLSSITERLRTLFEGWDRVMADPPAGLDPWARERLDVLVALARGAADAVAGDHLVHGDLRADDLLVRSDGSVVLVDWAHAGLGCAWLDTLTVLLDARLHDTAGEHDVEALLASVTSGVDPGAVSAVLAGLAGYFVDAARLPAPPALPTLRAFQAAEGATALAWVRERLGDPLREQGSSSPPARGSCSPVIRTRY